MCVIVCVCVLYVTQFMKTTLVARNHFEQTLTPVLLYRKAMKFGIHEGQLLLLLDTKFSLLPKQYG